MPNGTRHPRAVADVLEVDEDPLGGFGPQKRGVLFAAQRADDRLEHQVEFARLGQRAQFVRVWGQHFARVARPSSSDISSPSHASFVRVLGAQLEQLLRRASMSSASSLRQRR